MNCREQNDSLMGSIRECRNSISKLRSGSSHNLDIFGRWMTSLVNAIKNNVRRFQKEPIGPLGSMITIKDQKWTIPIQRCITSGNLYAFVVDNGDDAVILRQIMKEVLQRERASMKFMPFIIQYHYTQHYYSCSPRVSVYTCVYVLYISCDALMTKSAKINHIFRIFINIFISKEDAVCKSNHCTTLWYSEIYIQYLIRSLCNKVICSNQPSLNNPNVSFMVKLRKCICKGFYMCLR